VTRGLSDAAKELLDFLGLSADTRSPRAFEDLFLRFQARVPYETLSQTRRGELEPEALFIAFLEEGGGSAGEERARAFAALAEALGYDVRGVQGEARAGGAWRPHSALVARLGPSDALADAAYPLPVLLPIGSAEEIPTAYGKLSLARSGEELSVVFEGRGEREERIRLGMEPREGGVAEPTLDARLVRVLDDRVLTLQGGALVVEDAWSRLETPYDAAANADALKTLFAREDLSREELALLPPPASGSATLRVFDRGEADAGALRARLASPRGLLSLLAPGTRAEETTEEPAGWTWRLVEEDGTARAERVLRTASGLEVVPLDPEAELSRRVYAIEPRPWGAHLSLTVTLAREVPPLLLGESVRKTLVFHLASELLALSKETG
jgi:hypothetical protein